MTVIVPKAKWRKGIPIAQFGAGPNHSGNGAKPALYRKKHDHAQGVPGTPQGTCIAHTTRKDRESCRCGGHNR